MNDFRAAPLPNASVGCVITYVNVEIGYAILARLGGLTMCTSLFEPNSAVDAAFEMLARFGNSYLPAAFLIPAAGIRLAIRYETATYAIEPEVALTVLTMPELPLAPTPAGQDGAVPRPT